ncbi:MAG: hypothetical protein RI558_04015 [Psychroflexus sp.]|nr:hypothetical protein [Psychroflexus sp.]MDR9447980.1 hypothetical protein [Psychroflexus sp.]
MYYLSFNSKKTLEKEKLIFDEPLLAIILEYFHYIVVIISPIIFAVGFFYVQLNFRNPILFPFSIVTLILSFFISLFIFVQVKKSFMLRMVKGKENRKENMNSIEKISNKRNYKILYKDNYSHVILIEDIDFAYHNVRELFILYKDDKIYIRCLTYAMYGLKNPFHWISQKRIENMFIENLISKMP